MTPAAPAANGTRNAAMDGLLRILAEDHSIPRRFTVRGGTELPEALADDLARLVGGFRQVNKEADLQTALAVLIKKLFPKGVPAPEGLAPDAVALIRDEMFKPRD